MLFNKFLSAISTLSLIALLSCEQQPNLPKQNPLTLNQNATTAKQLALEVKNNNTIKLVEGLKLDLWATDSLAPDPIALDVDDFGSVYITRTLRQKHSEFDIRGYRDWVTPTSSFKTPEDRRNFLHTFFAPENSEQNQWLQDLNNDGSSDWKDLAIEKEEVWKLSDTNKDGLADVAQRIVHDFNTEITDVANALLVERDKMYVGVAPEMWELKDINQDGYFETKKALATGFGVHIGFSGHGMSGAIKGPDGKLYWGIGDIGGHIKAQDRSEFAFPNEGVIVRCNPDGSNFEVFAHGLRNTHEFVFDDYGNIISSDNDGDHRGESERLVHIVEGSDAGWRSNWQYGKYTDPKNNDYKVWMEEELYKPHWEGQAAYIIPPIMNYHNGPTGMVHNPGTALGSEWKNKFFLVEFVGDPSLSHLWAFDLKPKGASFELKSEVDVLSGILPTGIKFGPDGALYLADWLNGWGTKDSGRIWKLDVSEDKDDLAQQREETLKLMQANYEDFSNDELLALFQNTDRRIRLKAQYQLAKSTFWGYYKLKSYVKEEQNQLARIHGIWTLGMMAEKDTDKVAVLTELLEDNDPEIVAQSLKVLGDANYVEATEKAINLLQHKNDRVKFYAAQALGRFKAETAIEPLLDFVKSNNDEDLYLRHAAVLALARIGNPEPLIALSSSDNNSLKMAAVLVLRKLKDPKVALFLNDTNEAIATEAARAINDDTSIPEALPALAEVLNSFKFTNEALLRRAINAAIRVEKPEHIDYLIAFAKNDSLPENLRGEALAALGTWASLSVYDRVDGRYRGEVKRDAALVQEKVNKELDNLFQTKSQALLNGAIQLVANLGLKEKEAELVALAKSNSSESIRTSALNALGILEYEQLHQVLAQGMKDRSEQVRSAALGMLDKIELSKEALEQVVKPVFESASVWEQQKTLEVLAAMPIEKSKSILSNLISKADKNRLPNELILDLIESVKNSENQALIDQLAVLDDNGFGDDSYEQTLSGGSNWPGRQVFLHNTTAQCVRCHSYQGTGGKVGPALDNIGAVLSKKELLDALINPTKRIAPGYGSVTVTLTDGQEITGVLEAETEEELILKTGDAEPMEIIHSRIKTRKNLPSGMPPMGRMITKRELRDLIEFLSNLKE